MLRDTIFAFLHDRLGVDADEISDQTLLFSSGLLDSFSLVEIVALLERETGTRMDPADVDLEHLDSVERMLDWAEQSAANQDSAA